MILKPVGGSNLLIKELDGTPSINGVKELRVSNGSMTDLGGGVVQIAFPFDVDGGNFTDTYTYTNNIDGGSFV